MQPILGKGRGRDVKTTFDNVLDRLRQRVPASTEIALQHLNKLGCCNVADILVGQVGDTHNGTFLHGPDDFGVLTRLDNTDLVSQLCVLLFDYLVVVFQLFHHECAADDVNIVAQVLSDLCVLGTALKHTENIIFLKIPNRTLR